MIKAYLATIPTYYEGEDIQVRYSIIQDQSILKKEYINLDYVKPAVTGLIGMITLVNKLQEYKLEEIEIIIYDAALYELVNGTSTTKKGEILKIASKARRMIKTLKNLRITDVSKDHSLISDWDMKLK